MTKSRLTALTEDLCTNIAKYRPVQNPVQNRPSLLAWSCLDVLNRRGTIQGFDIAWIADAIRLLQALAAAGMDTRAPRTNVWIEKRALEIGLEGGQFVSALAYAGSEGWLADAPRRGWTSLTRTGAAIARR